MTRPWETIATAVTDDGPLELKRRGESDFLITLRGRVLMASSAHRSEDGLAKLACASIRDRAVARVLVSGLGMGFTLRAALDELNPRAHVVVAELNPVVAEWCRGPLAPLTRGAVNDSRVRVEIADVATVIGRVAKRPGSLRFDAIVLDMYEGPHAVVDRDDPLYGPAAVAATRDALARDGVFAVWCERPSIGFERSLRAAGFNVEPQRIGRGGSVHLVYLARPAGGQPSAAGASSKSSASRKPRPRS